LSTDRKTRSHENGSAQIADAKLRLYLLGALEEDERLKLDEKLLFDEAVAERVQLAESVLTDDYATEKLNPAERELFEHQFLVTNERRENLRLSAALRDYAEAQPATVSLLPEKSSWSERLAGLFALNSARGWAVAGSFAVLLLLVGLAWFVARQQQEPQPLIAKNEPTAAGSSQVITPASPAQVAPGSQPSPAPVASPATPEPSVPVTVASFVLMPGALRGGGDMARVAIPGGERDVVRLSLVIETPSEGSYTAELTTAEGQKVLVRTNLKITRNGHTKVVLTMPARLLHTRDYQIKLTRQTPDGQTESAGRYYFRAAEE
jgi:hypothetical protein